jgi:hypothetical protein
MQSLKKVPEKGFYYHYKHNPKGDVNNYAYEIVGVGHHTEEDGVYFVVYRPIYESSVYKEGKLFDIRPIEMFMENIIKDGVSLPRFRKITDQKIIAELEKIKIEMYG